MFRYLSGPARLFLMLPVLTIVWGIANSLGVTSYLATATGLPDASTWTIPGINKVIDASNEVQHLRGKAEEKARRALLAQVRKQVAAKYGPEAAAAIPEDVPLRRLRHLRPTDFATLAGLAKALDVPSLGNAVPHPPTGNTNGHHNGPGTGNGAGSGAGAGSGSTAAGVPFMNVKAYNKARDQIDSLPVKGKAPQTGYSREAFGDEWSDDAGNFFWTGNGCDTRNDVLKRDLVKVKFESGSTCDVASGVLPYDPYTGRKNRIFDANDDDYDTDLDTEHTVALGNAWVTGAFGWNEAKRAAFANDPLVLQMVDPSANRQKGDADAATWLPANKAYRCAYISRQIAIKFTYGLWVTAPEKAAMENVLAGCPR